jgi:hypothetical protein
VVLAVAVLAGGYGLGAAVVGGAARDDNAIERADRMISRLQPDADIEGIV